MRFIALPRLGTATAWRDAARTALVAMTPPDQLVWSRGAGSDDLFNRARRVSDVSATEGPAPSVPKSFVELADLVIWHADPERFALLYALLWRLRTEPRIVSDRGDPAVAKLQAMAKAVRRDMHKMKAFVRFRDVGVTGATRRRFAAWFEPSHFTLEPTAGFFTRRFGDMDWSILTPDLSAHFSNASLTFADGEPKPALPDDAAEALWVTYFRNIFNPARLKVNAMRAEMPKKYWKNLPEASAIPELIATAGARAKAMRENAPTLPPLRAARVHAHALATVHARPMEGGLPEFRTELRGCTRCALYRDATQAVPGEGPLDAPLMIVGEQPGDEEDLSGRPFVGPAGRLFDQVAAEAGLDRHRAYITNAVKHFKYVVRGKRRLHQRPNSNEISHCRWWLDAERALLKPKLILAMGASAAEALTGSGEGILKRRGTIETTGDGTPVLLTVHPSYLLRLPEGTARIHAIGNFRLDLEQTASRLRME
ncbi:UdgX family uracil-DNA binding protein [Mesorhizobium sp. NBSH29]|uniref:UdgX family uracil-DNA binding protein n=1 Tax=Mesorhizobium sp. NBSH29 TaxID=2654249 RepID=UPI0018964E50|nr:UdgX family uracil-DNA binding protein [Mesorhizobium sp. NBSH29]QPC87262.1 UdgX family uracil-DNA binding protein [Mesorhizobium sp. NBSH29]